MHRITNSEAYQTSTYPYPLNWEGGGGEEEKKISIISPLQFQQNKNLSVV